MERQCGNRRRAVGVTSTDLSASCRGPSLVRPMLKKRAPGGLRTPLRTSGNWQIFIRLWNIGLDTLVFSLQAPYTAPRNSHMSSGMNRYHTNTTEKVEDDRCRYKGSVVVWKSIMEHRRKGRIVGTRKSIIPRPQTGDRTCPASSVWQRKSLFGRQHQEGKALFGSRGG